MTLAEFDWRIDPLYDVVVGIDAALAAIGRRMHEDDWFDGLWAREHVEPVLGLGFVAAQTYAVGTWSHLNKIRSSSGKSPIDKRACYGCDPIKVKGQVTRLELINATANYFKHHDEWTGWSDNRAAATTQILNRVGITEQSESPCIEAAEVFCGSGWEFILVHEVVKEWRAHVHNVFR